MKSTSTTNKVHNQPTSDFKMGRSASMPAFSKKKNSRILTNKVVNGAKFITDKVCFKFKCIRSVNFHFKVQESLKIM